MNFSRDVSADPRNVVSVERDASRYCRLNDEWLLILEEVRKPEGFEGFLCLMRRSTLLGAAAGALVVILNASITSCAAIDFDPCRHRVAFVAPAHNKKLFNYGPRSG